MDTKTLPTLTIVTICFNSAAFVRKTLESVIAQDYPHLEYLVVDGGSSDSTPSIVREYERSITWWVSERDSGVSEAFNKGIARSTGDFIGFLNAGDYFYKSDALSELFRRADPEADIVYGKARLTFDPPLGGVSEKIAGLPRRPLYKLPTAHQAMFYRRRVWERYGTFSLDYRYSMDYEHYLRLRRQARWSFADVIVAERPLTLARNSFGNPSRTYGEYLKADAAHWNAGIVANALKFARDRIKERLRGKS